MGEDSGDNREIEVSAEGVDELRYPDIEDVLDIHSEIIEDDPNAEPGLKHSGSIEYAIDHIQHEHFGEGPETLHEKAYQLMRLIAANHPFVDGNKRTALASTVYFYFWNGYDLSYQEEIESMLILISIREDFIDPNVAVEYLESIAEEFTVDDYLEVMTQMFDHLLDVSEKMTTDDENGG